MPNRVSPFPTEWKVPTQCSDRELELFEELVLLGGEVDPNGFSGRILRAERLVFGRTGELIVAVAGLKRPGRNYRARTALKSGLCLAEADWPFEFGWVFVCPSARRQGVAYDLVANAVDGIRNGIFATSRADNTGMHKPLRRAGFDSEGNTYDSVENKAKILIFRKKAA